MGDAVGQRLTTVLLDAQRRGFIGPGPLQPHLAHAARFAAVVDPPPTTALDLGSGSGLPGLALALGWPTTAWILLDASARRTEFLRWAVDELHLGDRVVVDHRRAEVAGRDLEVRGSRDLVVARAFGPPAVVAECAAPFLAVGGVLVVSEPPDAPDRWPPQAVAALGLVAEPIDDVGFVRLRQTRPCPDRFPRRDGIPAKRPIF